MKEMICKNCGKSLFIRTNEEKYICQECNSAYSVYQARKMMTEDIENRIKKAKETALFPFAWVYIFTFLLFFCIGIGFFIDGLTTDGRFKAGWLLLAVVMFGFLMWGLIIGLKEKVELKKMQKELAKKEQERGKSLKVESQVTSETCWRCHDNLWEHSFDVVDLVGNDGVIHLGYKSLYVCRQCGLIYSTVGLLWNYQVRREGEDYFRDEFDYYWYYNDHSNTFADDLVAIKPYFKDSIDKEKYISFYSEELNRKREKYRLNREKKKKEREKKIDEERNKKAEYIKMESTQKPEEKYNVAGAPARCVYCGSTSLQAIKRGANVGGAATGFFLAGWLGAFVGATQQSEAIDIICLNCKKKQPDKK